MRDAIAYIPAEGIIIKLSEGTGDNLDRWAVEDGYVDYIYYEIDEPDWFFTEVDGGITLVKQLVENMYESLEDALPEVIERHFEAPLEYVVLRGRE